MKQTEFDHGVFQGEVIAGLKVLAEGIEEMKADIKEVKAALLKKVDSTEFRESEHSLRVMYQKLSEEVYSLKEEVQNFKNSVRLLAKMFSILVPIIGALSFEQTRTLIIQIVQAILAQ